jgi:hypothetical protein
MAVIDQKILDDICLKTNQISMRALKLIGELDEFKGAWQLLSAISPERLATLKHIATIESIGSSTRIEGSSLSNEEVERVFIRSKYNFIWLKR